jgi:DNA-binding NarL/FixJ family response regulator
MSSLRIILADDHHLFRDGIKSLLMDEESIEIVGEVSNGKELLELLKEVSADLIISDISMPEMNGIEACRIVKQNFPDIKFLILSMHNNEEFIKEAISMGTNGYLPKDISREELLKGIFAIKNGQDYFSEEISKTIMQSFIYKVKHEDDKKEECLTKREIEILKYVSEGYINKEIADLLNISIRTVDSHKNNIMNKLKLKSSIDMVKYAIKNNLVKL